MRRLILIATFTAALAACGGGTPPGQRPENTATPTSPSAPPTTTTAGTANTPQPTPTPTSTTPGTYTVIAGDTLWAVAERFETTVDAIVALNSLADADSIEVGQVLKLPGPATPTPATTATPSATPTP